MAWKVAGLVGLASMLDQPASELTAAGRKRLSLARALATEPKLLLLDEVLAGLNPSEIRDMIPVIRAIQESGATILMVEHVMQAVMSLCQHIHVLAEGQIIAAWYAFGGVTRRAGDRGVSRAWGSQAAPSRGGRPCLRSAISSWGTGRHKCCVVSRWT